MASVSSTPLTHSPFAFFLLTFFRILLFLKQTLTIIITFIIKQGFKMQERIDRIVKILDEKKAENIEVVDMRGNDYLASFVVVATTLTARHGVSLLDELKTTLKPLGEVFLGSEESDEWVAVDMGDIFVHLMSENYRAKYNIEEFLKSLKKASF